MSIATTAPQRSQGMILLSITFLGFQRAPRRIDRSRLFRICAKSRFHLASQFQPQGFEDCRPLHGYWIGWITNHFAGDMAAPVIQFLQQDAPQFAQHTMPENVRSGIGQTLLLKGYVWW